MQTSLKAGGRILSRVLAGALLVAGATLGLIEPAAAGTNEAITVAGGRVTFHHRGDVLTAVDGLRDRRCVRAHLSYFGAGPNSPIIHELVTACGVGKVAQRSLGLPEGISVDIQACYIGAGTDTCSRFQAAHS